MPLATPSNPFAGNKNVIFSAQLIEEFTDIRSESVISWVENFSNPGSEDCDWQGIIRIPFNSSSCYRFLFTFLELTGFNFHISNGCGDG